MLDPDDRRSYQNRGSYFSLDHDHPNVLEPGKRTLHTLLPGMLFRDGIPSRGSWPGRWAATRSHRSTPSSCRRWSMAASTCGRRSLRRAGSSSRPALRAAGRRPARAPARARESPEALEALGHPLTRPRAFDSGLGHEHAIELVAGGPTAADGSLAAVTDPRSDGLPAVW